MEENGRESKACCKESKKIDRFYAGLDRWLGRKKYIFLCQDSRFIGVYIYKENMKKFCKGGKK